MRISEVSEAFGISPDTLRYYEKIQLIPPVARDGSGVRDYGEADLMWIGFIKCMRNAGMSVDLLVRYVGLCQQGDATIAARKEMLMDQREQLAARMKQLQETLDLLDRKIALFEVMDHFYQIKGLFGEAYTDPMMESYTTLGYCAGLTEKIHLGVLVTGVIYRYPSVLMKTISTLDILAGGRTYFGIGAAWYEAEAIGYGIPYPSTSERFEQLEDTVKLAKALWASDEISFAGSHFSAPAITNNPRPISNPHPRIMIGGTGPKKTLRMVAQYADACNIGDWVGAENMQKALDTLKEHCDTLGRDYATVEKTSLCTVQLTGGDTAASVIRRIQELAGMGFTHAIFNMPDVYAMTPLETFAREIIPAVGEQEL